MKERVVAEAIFINTTDSLESRLRRWGTRMLEASSWNSLRFIYEDRIENNPLIAALLGTGHARLATSLDRDELSSTSTGANEQECADLTLPNSLQSLTTRNRQTTNMFSEKAHGFSSTHAALAS